MFDFEQECTVGKGTGKGVKILIAPSHPLPSHSFWPSLTPLVQTSLFYQPAAAAKSKTVLARQNYARSTGKGDCVLAKGKANLSWFNFTLNLGCWLVVKQMMSSVCSR